MYFQFLDFNHFKIKIFGSQNIAFSLYRHPCEKWLTNHSLDTGVACSPERTRLMKMLGSDPVSTSWGTCNLLFLLVQVLPFLIIIAYKNQTS